MGKGLLTLSITFLLFGICHQTNADDAKVLPENIFRVQFVSAFSFIENKFDESGSSVGLGDDYSYTLRTPFIAAMKPQVQEMMKQLSQVSPALENIGVADLGMKINSQVISNRFVLEYGITDRLSVGVIMPFVYAKVSVDATSEPNPEIQQAIEQAPATMKAGLTALRDSMSLQAINETLTNDLGYNSGLESWSGTGFGDLEIGAKYNYLKSHPVAMTFKGGTRIPTGRQDDPDNLFDIGFGDGQFDIGMYNYIDYHALSNLYFTLETGYTVQLPHTTDYRVPVVDDVDISPTRARLTRNPGDIVEAGFETHYQPFKFILSSLKYRYYQKFEDSFSGGSDSLNLAFLEDDSDRQAHEAIVRIGYSSIPAVRAKRMKWPFSAEAFYRYPFAGTNVSQAHTGGIQLKSYF